MTRTGADAALAALRGRLVTLEGPTLRAPAALVVCAVHGVRVGVDLALCREVLPLAATTPVPEAPPWVLGLVRVAEREIAVLDLVGRIEGSSRLPALDEHILVVHADDRELGIVVESVFGVVATEGASLQEPPVGELASWMLGVVEHEGDPIFWLEPAALLVDLPGDAT